MASQVALQLLAVETDRDTIAKQRHELQLLIEELKDRDRELNEMAATHRQQLSAWDDDRRRLLGLDDRNARLEHEIHRRGEQVRGLLKKLKITESEFKTKRSVLESTQTQLEKMAEEQSRTSMHLRDFEEKNHSLNASLTTASQSLEDLKSHEQELLAVIQLKEKDLSDSSRLVVELSSKLRSADQLGKQAEKNSQEASRLGDEWKDKYFESKGEAERVHGEFIRAQTALEEKTLEIDKISRELACSKTDVVHAVEREKRKDQLIELQRSKQERTDAELTSLRQVYDRTRRDLEALYHSLESSRHGIFEMSQEEQDDDIDGFSIANISSFASTSPVRLSPIRSPAAGDAASRSSCRARRGQQSAKEDDSEDKLASSLERLTMSLDVLADLHDSSVQSLGGAGSSKSTIGNTNERFGRLLADAKKHADGDKSPKVASANSFSSNAANHSLDD